MCTHTSVCRPENSAEILRDPGFTLGKICFLPVPGHCHMYFTGPTMVRLQISPVRLPISHFLGCFGQRKKLQLIILSSGSTFAEDLLGNFHPPCLHNSSGSLFTSFYTCVTANLHQMHAPHMRILAKSLESLPPC